MFAEINISGGQIVAIAFFTLVFLPGIIGAFRIGKLKRKKNAEGTENIVPEWLNISENEFNKKLEHLLRKN